MKPGACAGHVMFWEGSICDLCVLSLTCQVQGCEFDTYKTKLKLDKEVGGGDLSDLCTITYLIAYPYA